MKQTKNNTCKICGEHIDKSSCANSWTTIINSSYWDSNDQPVKGERFTLAHYVLQE